MNVIHGLLLMFGDLLLKIPFVIWIVAFILVCIWLIKDENANVSNIMIVGYIAFYFMLIHKIGIATSLIGAFNLGLIIPILSMLVLPYLATLATAALLGLIKNNLQ